MYTCCCVLVHGIGREGKHKPPWRLSAASPSMVSASSMTGSSAGFCRVHQLTVPGQQVENLVVKVLTSPRALPGPTSQKRDRAFSSVLVG